MGAKRYISVCAEEQTSIQKGSVWGDLLGGYSVKNSRQRAGTGAMRQTPQIFCKNKNMNKEHDPAPRRHPWRRGGCEWGKIIFNLFG
jgi:hypothetical protein